MSKQVMKDSTPSGIRRGMTIILARIEGRRAIHFTEQPLAGRNNDVWFPIGNEDLFRAIENIMVINNQANNLTLVSRTREISDTCYDYTITYNRRRGHGMPEVIKDDGWSPLQKNILKAYEGGEFSHISPDTLDDCGDGLLCFLMAECSPTEDCLSNKDASLRIATAIQQLREVSDFLEQM